MHEPRTTKEIRVTPNQFKSAVGCTSAKVSEHFSAALYAMTLFGIITGGRGALAAFLANVGHETLGLVYGEEIWGPTAAQKRYEIPSDLAKQLGNVLVGDGLRFKGRGPMMLTGRANYQRATLDLRRELARLPGVPIPSSRVPDFEASPDALAEPSWGWLVAAQFFASRGCIPLAAKGNFDGVCRVLNGGANGLADRRARYAAAQKVLA